MLTQQFLKAFLLTIMVILNYTSVFADKKTDEKLLREITILSQEVKKFEPLLGIKPTKALTKSALDKRPITAIYIYLQKEGTIALNSKIDQVLRLTFSGPRDSVLLREVELWNSGYYYYLRKEDAFANKEAVISRSLIERSYVYRVEAIFHEDIHQMFEDLPWQTNESFTTALSILATLRFFEARGDTASTEKTLKYLTECKFICSDILAIAFFAKNLFRNEPLKEARLHILEFLMISKKDSKYSRYLDNRSVLYDQGFNEAVISHDLGYFRWFNYIMRLYEETRDFKTLLTDLQRAPYDVKKVEPFLDGLMKKYRKL